MTFHWQGQPYALESDDGRGNGIHGYVHRRPWRVIDRTHSSVTGQFHASADDPDLLSRWPADFQLEVRYALQGNRLDCRMIARNPDDRPLPCGLGSHPYFRLPLGEEGDAETCRLRLPASAEWRLKEMLPTGEKLPSERSLREGAPLAERSLDNVFGDLIRDDRWFAARLDDPQNQRSLHVRFDEPFRDCVVYTPPHREAVCIEPYSCVPGAAGRDDFDHGFWTLDPGGSVTAEMQIELTSLAD